VRRDLPAVTPPASTVDEVVTWTEAENLFTYINITILQGMTIQLKFLSLNFHNFYLK
jgi:hypothetical protein